MRALKPRWECACGIIRSSREFRCDKCGWGYSEASGLTTTIDLSFAAASPPALKVTDAACVVCGVVHQGDKYACFSSWPIEKELAFDADRKAGTVQPAPKRDAPCSCNSQIENPNKPGECASCYREIAAPVGMDPAVRDQIGGELKDTGGDVKPEIVTKRYFACPECGDLFEVEHLFGRGDMSTIWACDICGARWGVAIDGDELDVTPKGRLLREWVIVELPPSPHSVYVLVKRRAIGSHEYNINEHTCPTNWFADVEEMAYNCSGDPHGLWRYVTHFESREEASAHMLRLAGRRMAERL